MNVLTLKVLLVASIVTAIFGVYYCVTMLDMTSVCILALGVVNTLQSWINIKDAQ